MNPPFSFPRNGTLTAAILGLVLTFVPRALASDAVVTFNELHYHPAKEADPEWIELHNQMSIRIDLSGWRLSGGIGFEFPEGTVIEPRAFIVVHGFGEMPDALGPFLGRLDNAGERINLRDRNDRVMDQLDYDDEDPWPVGPDGSGMTLAKRRPNLATAEAASWGTSLEAGGTPGAPNENLMEVAGLVLSEIAPGMVELQNRGPDDISLAGVELRNQEEAEVLEEGILGAGEYRVWQTVVAEEDAPIFLFDAGGRLLDAVLVRDRVQGRLEDSLTWYFTDVPTPGAANQVTLEDGIVINEVMYHFPPDYDQPGTVENEYREREEEWVELYNRSERTIDLSGWEIGGGIRFQFPPGSTLAADGYLIVAREADSLRVKYPDITIAGSYEGKLSNSSDVILLFDARGNLADQMRYYDDGRWPRFADGGGCSLELRDPWADNSVPEAWDSSREEDKSEWVTLEYEGHGAEPVRSNNPSNFHEFLMGLLDAGEVLVDNVSVIEDPHGAATELMKNGGFKKTNVFTGEVTDWRMLGTHVESRVESDPTVNAGDPYLRIIADGAIEHSYNNVSSTFPLGHRLDAQQTYAISLRAKWVRGSPQLNTRLYLNRLARTHILPIPEHLGTPGRENSISPGNIGPTMDRLRVEPLAPAANEPIDISVEARDPQGVREMKIWYRPADGEWQAVPMLFEEKRALGQIPGQPDGRLIQFYIEAIDGENVSATLPAAGPDSRALLRVGETRVGNRVVNHVRLFMSPEEHNRMRRPEHAVSNGRIGGTLIVNDEDYHFDVGVRLRSSPFGRRSNRTGYNVALSKEYPYRGVHDSIAIDRGSVMPNGNSNGFFEVKAGAGVNELVVNQIAQRARGIPTTYEDVIFIETPNINESSLAQVRTARYGSNYLDSQYENGAQGPTHKFELIYHPTGTIDGRSDGLKGPYERVLPIDIQDMRDDKEAYRYNFIPTNNRDRDDFTGIIRLGDAFSSRTDLERREKIPAVIDVDQWMRAFALQSLIGVADTYNMGLEHNLVLYTRPSDGRVLAFPWDLDHAFYYSTNAALLGRGGTNLGRFINLPENQRLFYGHLHDIIETAYNVEAMRPWIAHLNEVTENNYVQRFLDYIAARGNFVRSELKNVVSSVFQITTNGGNSFETNEPTVVLEGQGWIDVRAIRLEGTGALLDLEWTDLNVWRTVVPLTLGENNIILQAVNFQGRDLGSFFSPGTDTLTVTHTGSVEAARAGNLVISEIHYHPAGDDEGTEFLELRNTGPHPIDLAGIRFTRGVNWEHQGFEAWILAPGELALLVLDEAAFENVYGGGERILGSYAGTRLANGGETLRLEDRAGGVIQEFAYGDGPAWPQAPDGQGHSLVYRSGDPANAFSWRSSREEGGSPGVDETERHEESMPWETYAFGQGTPLSVNGHGELTMRYRTTADDLRWTLEYSRDLRLWENAGEEVELISREEDPDVFLTILTWKTMEAFSYYRLSFHLKP